jgi:hypothetical protein
VAVFENRQPVTKAKFINKSSLFILSLGIIRLLELKPISDPKVEHIFVNPPYCQTDVIGRFGGSNCCQWFFAYRTTSVF